MKNFLLSRIKEKYEVWQKVGNPAIDAFLFFFFVALSVIFAWMIGARLESGQDVPWQLMAGFIGTVLSAGVVPVGILSEIRDQQEPKMGKEA